MSAPPVRLKVSYKSPEALLGELTRSVGRGGVRIESHRALEVGTQFIFELKSSDMSLPVEVNGTVMSVSESAPGKWVLHIRYEPPRNRVGLDAVLGRIFSTEKADKQRHHARVPLQVRAVEDAPDSPQYRLRDLSRGGVGIDVEGDAVPHHIVTGTPFLMQMKVTSGQLVVHGEVVWVVASKVDGLPAQVGVAFGKLSFASQQLLDDVLTLKVLPAPPWIARLVFGPAAVERMPFT